MFYGILAVSIPLGALLAVDYYFYHKIILAPLNVIQFPYFIVNKVDYAVQCVQSISGGFCVIRN